MSTPASTSALTRSMSIPQHPPQHHKADVPDDLSLHSQGLSTGELFHTTNHLRLSFNRHILMKNTQTTQDRELTRHLLLSSLLPTERSFRPVSEPSYPRPVLLLPVTDIYPMWVLPTMPPCRPPPIRPDPPWTSSYQTIRIREYWEQVILAFRLFYNLPIQWIHSFLQFFCLFYHNRPWHNKQSWYTRTGDKKWKK